MKLKSFLQKNKFYIILGISIFLISLLFPYTGDDWVFGSYKLDLNIFSSFCNDGNLNGRYLGNLMAVLLTRNIIIRGLIMSLVITLLFKLTSKYINKNIGMLLLLFLLLPYSIFRQVIPWSAGFANYMVSTLILLYLLYVFKNNIKINYIIVFLLSISVCLFLENYTVFYLLFTLFINIRYFIKNKKINKLYLIAFIGCLIGSFIMFSHPSYLTAYNGSNPSKLIGHDKNIKTIIIYNFCNYFYTFGIWSNIFHLILLEIIIFAYYFKNINKYNSKIFYLFGLSYILLLYIGLSKAIPVLDKLENLNGIIGLIYLIVLIILLVVLFRKDKKNNYIWELLIILMFIQGPLLVVSPIGPRNFLLVTIFIDLIIIRIYNDYFIDFKYKNKLNVIIWLLVAIISISYIYIYGSIRIVDVKRNNFVKEHVCLDVIVVPKLPFDKYVWWPDFDGEMGDYYPRYYRKYMKIDKKVKFEFYDYMKWKDKIKDISTCS